MRQIREAKQDLMNVQWDQEAAQGEMKEDEWMEAWDDVKNRELDPKMVMRARGGGNRIYPQDESIQEGPDQRLQESGREGTNPDSMDRHK